MQFLLCLLPVIVQARITIDIHASKTTHESSTVIKGSSHNIITKEDLTIFTLEEKVLKNAVYNLSGRIPTNIYLKSPTPWNDLYKTYGWKQVTTVLKPIRTRIVNISKERVILSRKDAVNIGLEATVQKVSGTAKVENKVSSYWGEDTKPFNADIDYDINFDGIGNVSKLTLNSTWGFSLHARAVGVGSPYSVEVNLESNQRATVVLSATKVSVEVGVDYMAILDGYVATNNEELLEGHHFWAYDIASVMEAIPDVRQNVTTSEDIVIEFYNDPKITVQDFVTIV